MICFISTLKYDTNPCDIRKLFLFVFYINRSGFATRKCYPVMDVLQPAAELNFNQIYNSWYYSSPARSKPAIKVNKSPRNSSVLVHVNNFHPSSNQTQKQTRVNTLEQWLDTFVGMNPRSDYYKHLKLLWLDVKVPVDKYVFGIYIHIYIYKKKSFLFSFLKN